jgi:hypothetical protein
MDIAIGLLFFGLYMGGQRGFSVTGLDLLPMITPAVIGGALFALGTVYI